MIPGGVNPMLLSGSSGYQSQRSLRFRAAASATLSRTPSATGNRKLWSWSGWVKRGDVAGNGGLLTCRSDANNYSALEFVGGELRYLQASGGTVTLNKKASALFRDPSAWLHVVAVLDTDNATAEDRFRLFINNVRVTAWSVSTNAALGLATGFISTTTAHSIGIDSSLAYFDGYLDEVHFIDGQALAPSAFGQYDPSGMWQPKPYAGTYGANGFRLLFDNPTSTTTLVADSSGNSNNWTANNISLTAGATYDSMIDVPLGSGGAERGNYATWNPLNHNSNVSPPTEGNLKSFVETGAAFVRGSTSTQAVDAAGNWWAEFTLGSLVSSAWVGIAPSSLSISGVGADLVAQTGVLTYRDNGQKCSAATSGSAYGSTYTSNDVIGISLNAGVLTFYKQTGGTGAFVSQGSAYTGLSGLYYFCAAGYGSPSTFWVANFGQRPFNNSSLPAGARAIHTGNLPAAAIPRPSDHFDVVTQLGSAVSTGAALLSQKAYTYELAWGKDRAAVNNHQLVDTVRGGTAVLQSNGTGAETTYAAPTSGDACVSWHWNAASAAISNTNGTIASQVSANPSAGFSIATFTAPSSAIAFTVGHGLGVAPAMVIRMSRNQPAPNRPHIVYHKNSAATPQNNYLFMNTVAPAAADSTMFNNTAPTSAVVSYGTYASASETFVQYSFAEIPGFSKFGSYTGNGSADGPMVYCGFRPRFVMVKRTDSTGDWIVWDTARNTGNSSGLVLYPNLSNAEGSGVPIDVLANGFKIRDTSASDNASGGSYVFMALAEAPFQSALAR